MTRRRTLAVFALISAPLASTAQAQTDTRSSGVRVVENVGPRWSTREQPRLSPAPHLTIGDASAGDQRLQHVRGVFRVGKDHWFVVDARARALKLFNDKGAIVSVTPIPIDASEQPRSIDQAHRLAGDTIAISGITGPVALYTSTGVYARSLGPSMNRNAPSRQLNVALFADGRRVATTPPRPASRAKGMRWADSLDLRLYGDRDSVGVPLGRFAYVQFEQGPTHPSPVWLSPIFASAGGHDRVYVGFGDRYEIQVFDRTGVKQLLIRRAWTPTPITAGEWETWVVEWSKLWIKEQGAARDSALSAIRESPYAEELPAFSAMLVDRSGRLWVRSAHWQDAIAAGSLTDMPAVPSQWSVFDSAGRWLGDVDMPSHFQPYDIGADYVAGAATRAGAHRVEVYSLTSTRH